MAKPKGKKAEIDLLFSDFNKSHSPGVAVLVAKNRHILYKKAFGYANLEQKIPVTPKTNFRLASVTKQFTAMAIMLLIERKQLSLNLRLTDIFPDFPGYGKTITLRHLLNHTSGLLDYEKLIPKGTSIPILDRDVLWLLEQQKKTKFPPGTQYAYSNTGYAILATIVEKISGMTFAGFMKKDIFDPLKMTNTLLHERGISIIPNRAYGYTKRSSRFKRTDQSLTSYVLGDGGIYSSVEDLYKWDQSLYTSKLVSRKLLQQAFTPGPNTMTPTNTGYGFGWRISDYRGFRCIHHTGSSIGFSNIIQRYPNPHITVIILTNRSNAGVIQLAQKITNLFLIN